MSRLLIYPDRNSQRNHAFEGVPGKRMRFDASVSLSDRKSTFEAVNDGGITVDYQNVTIKGYLSTWQHVTPSDRQGDYVVAGAFTDTIADFMRNPVMLADHDRGIRSVIGAFTVVKEDGYGLYVEGKLSNSSDDFMRGIRFKVAEGILKTLSMGGVFHYNEDGRGIFKVTLWEGSIVSVPANPDAVFSVRELTESEAKRAEGLS